MPEYKVVPAPNRAPKLRGIKSPADRFAKGLAGILNEHAAHGWEFVRSETFTVEEARGWFGKIVSVTRTVLVLRREVPPATTVAQPVEPFGRSRPLVPIDEAPERRPEGVAARAAPGSERPEPIFRPGAMMRSEALRKYPPLRQPEGEAPDEAR
jgi:hypothetical protein